MRRLLKIVVFAAFVGAVAMLSTAAVAGDRNVPLSGNVALQADVRANAPGNDLVAGSSGPVMTAWGYGRCRWVKRCVRWRNGHCVKRVWVWRCGPRHRW
jgi:hypothetical protein